jgi:hypothetical protein
MILAYPASDPLEESEESEESKGGNSEALK